MRTLHDGEVILIAADGGLVLGAARPPKGRRRVVAGVVIPGCRWLRVRQQPTHSPRDDDGVLHLRRLAYPQHNVIVGSYSGTSTAP
jgi:hypothetical protein